MAKLVFYNEDYPRASKLKFVPRFSYSKKNPGLPLSIRTGPVTQEIVGSQRTAIEFMTTFPQTEYRQTYMQVPSYKQPQS